MRRRDVLKLCATALASELWPLTAWAQIDRASRSRRRFIDVHCHVFNADDLPIEGFIEKVVLRDLIVNLKKKQQTTIAALIAKHPESEKVVIHMLASLMRKQAPNPQQEIELIETMENGHHDAAERIAKRTQREVAFIQELLNEIWWPAELDRELRRVGDVVVPNTVLNELKYRIRKDIHPLANEDELRNPDQDEDLGRYAQELYDSDRSIGFLLRWALRLTRYRFELVDELYAIHGQNVELLTPALVDFSSWLEGPNADRERRSRQALQKQTEVMGRIARRKQGARVHGFAPFDPLRQALYDQQSRAGKAQGASPLDIVKVAIIGDGTAAGALSAGYGFLGVKLYPPMGFRPIDNASLRDQFPAQVKSPDSGLGPDVGERLDEALKSLYVWCRDNNVPIMAHANNSNATHAGYGERAHPQYWALALQTKDAKGNDFSKLHVNLAHFGGFEELFNNPKDQDKPELSWEWAIGRIWKQLPAAHVYADISYFNEILVPDSDDKEVAQASARRRAQVKELFIEFKRQFPMSANRLLYGTDWVMVGAEIGFPETHVDHQNQIIPAKTEYPQIVAEFLSEVGYDDAAIDAILFRNAISFLGLAPKDTNNSRGRLQRFYQQAGLSAAWLSALDQQ